MPPEGLDEARDAFAVELPQASRPRDQAGRFVATSGKPEPIFSPRDTEGDPLTGDTSDGGADPRFLEMERRAADGRSDEGEDGGRSVSNDAPQRHNARNAAADQGDDEGAGHLPPERFGQETDAASQDVEKRDARGGSEQEVAEDQSPRYEIEVDGQKVEVSLNEALRTYQREESFNRRVAQMVEVARAIDQRGLEASQARDAYIQLCQRQDAEFEALIPREPNWEALYKQDPAGAHQLENNYRAIYSARNQVRQRIAMAQHEAHASAAQRTAEYARAEFDKFRQKNRLTDQQACDKAIAAMRQTAKSHQFSEDEISSTYDERMLSVLHKAAKYDAIIASRPVAVQPDRGSAMHPGSAPRVGNGAMRNMSDAQRRLAASGRMDDAASVMFQLIRPGR